MSTKDLQPEPVADTRLTAEQLDRLGQVVHAAWRDGMQGQYREVSPERMTWATLAPIDRVLDRYIAEMVYHAVALEPADDGARLAAVRAEVEEHRRRLYIERGEPETAERAARDLLHTWLQDEAAALADLAGIRAQVAQARAAWQAARLAGEQVQP